MIDSGLLKNDYTGMYVGRVLLVCLSNLAAFIRWNVETYVLFIIHLADYITYE